MHLEHDFVVAVEITQVQLPVEEEMAVQVHSLQGTSWTPHIAVL